MSRTNSRAAASVTVLLSRLDTYATPMGFGRLVQVVYLQYSCAKMDSATTIPERARMDLRQAVQSKGAAVHVQQAFLSQHVGDMGSFFLAFAQTDLFPQAPIIVGKPIMDAVMDAPLVSHG